MADDQYTVKLVAGLKRSDHRAIAFLWSDFDDDVNAGRVFEGLRGKTARELRSRFDYWLDGGIQDRYFHGWPNSAQYKDCWVFKWKENRKCHRLYGFLFHPTPLSTPRFQLCVLVSHATKSEWETDPAELEGAKELRENASVIAAIRKAFPDSTRGKTQWLN
jgi:hypothetical protein